MKSSCTTHFLKINICWQNYPFGHEKDNLFLPKIEIPRGYIRKKAYFEDTYKLNKIFDLFEEGEIIDNLAYSFQYTDFLNYLFNRFKIGEDGLSVGLIFRKTSIIYIMTIIETIIKGLIDKAYKECKSCNKKCGVTNNQHLFGARSSRNFSVSLKKIYDSGIINKQEFQDYDKYRKIRNDIHIYLFNENAFRENYEVNDYSKTIKLLKLTNKLYDRFQKIECEKIKESFV